jgi:hypothetical protein
MHWIDTIFALAFIQNIIVTGTGLIICRIWRPHRSSQDIISSSLRPIVVVRVIVKSASIYVLNDLILDILPMDNSLLPQIVPVCGEFCHANLFNNYQIFMLCSICQDIVFMLITVRLSLHTSTFVTTTQLPGTQMKFAGP